MRVVPPSPSGVSMTEPAKLGVWDDGNAGVICVADGEVIAPPT